MERCPNCRARLDGAEQCRRCGMVVGLLQAVDRASRALLVRASQCLADGNVDAAIDVLRQARRLRRDPLTSAMLVFARSERVRCSSDAGTQENLLAPRIVR